MERIIGYSKHTEITVQDIKKQIRGQKTKLLSSKISGESIIYLMKKFDNNKSTVADKLGLSRRHLIRLCKSLEPFYPFLRK